MFPLQWPIPLLFSLFLYGVLLVNAEPIDVASQENSTRTFEECLTKRNVPAVNRADQPRYARLAKPFNLRLPYEPAIIVLPSTPQHISDTIICAGITNTKVQARSGGHSYASYSSGGQNGSLVVHLEALQDVAVDEITGIAKVGAGVRLGNLALELHRKGGRAVPHGICPGVGVGGHFTHGGYGYASRMWGLALDSIVGLDVVLANGSFVHASDTEYPDLYFALRGAADSFGIITTFYLQTQSAPSTLVNFDLNISSVLESKEIAARTFFHLQKLALDSSVVDRRLVFGTWTDRWSFYLSGWFFGSLEEFNQRIQSPLFQHLPEPDSTKIRELDWIASLENVAKDSMQVATTDYDKHATFYAKSIVVQQSTPLTRKALESYFNYAINEGRRAPLNWFSVIDLYGGPDSRISGQSQRSSAYAHRSALWVVQNYGYVDEGVPFQPEMVSFIDGLNNALTNTQPDGDFSAYVNYVDPSLSAPEAHRLYYGDELYRKLLAIKREVDPQEIFWNPQAIGVD
ncbi:MAG: hypothetical protein M1823_000579 [Watsoniomyces obsoletus]|nr:MAG: hypothetical protein M1823_000579 [Watsoniomyces obsoletus]